MRDYLKLIEIEDILEKYQHINKQLVTDIMADVRHEADTCLCFAHSYSECTCGAWEYNEDDCN